MQFFKRYQREISTFILLSLLQSFVFEVFAAYAKPIPFGQGSYFYAPTSSLDLEENPIQHPTKQEKSYVLDLDDLVSVQQETVESVNKEVEKKTQTYTTSDGRTVLYEADIIYGVIGIASSMPYDDPEDNLFKVNLTDEINSEATYVLSYELYGASSAAEVAKSINTTTSIGGYLKHKNQEWTRVEEYISPFNLKQGINTILFTADLQQENQYIVRNLRIEKRLQQERTEEIQVNNTVRDSLTGKVYVSGIVPQQEVELFISGKRIPVVNHTFEYVQEGNEETSSLKMEMKKGNDLWATTVVPIAKSKALPQTKALTSPFKRHEFEVKKSNESNVFTQGKAGIQVPTSSFAKDFTLSIQELRPSDYAPTGMTLVNVTSNNGAYRFLPDGIQFDQEVTLTIPYDVTALPRGYSAKDIQVFYFDTAVKQWMKVKVIDVLEESQQVVAVTNHFTDYLAGVIQEPESPDGNAFAPTALSGIQAVNPTESIPTVGVPQINDRGDAALSFPLVLPQGRHGMTPDISVNYNSSSDEGDFGLGWSLSVPTISVDTRWGVPLYDTAKETESYLFNGEELLLVKSDQTLYAPHKDPLMGRVANATFRKSQYNPNQEIKRLGSINNYTWEIVDKSSGWTYSYTTQAKGKWYLTKVTDAFNNFMQYFYGNNGNGDYQLSEIVYNVNSQLSSDNRHEFKVTIMRKKTIDSPSGNRRDVRLSNRAGVEVKSIDLIDKIRIETTPKGVYKAKVGSDVVHLGNVWNEYQFFYKAGQFGRSLLYKIVNKNRINNTRDGNWANTDLEPITEEYNLEYYDDIAGGSLFESSGKTYNTYKDYATDYDAFKVYLSALGGTEGKSTNYNGGGSVGVVTPIFPNSWLPFSRAATIGGNLGGGSSNSESKVMMTDIDGDGLPDKVFKDGGKFYFRKNLGDKFSQDVYPIKNLPNLSYSRSTNSDMGFSVNIFVGNISRSNSKSSTKTSTYMADVNADGLLDVVDNERVYFGYIDPVTKAPTYSLDSSITPVIILKEEDVAPVLNPIPQVDMTNGPMDIVMVWRAPKPGQVKVSGTIMKQHVGLENGVKFSIERLHESNMENATFVLGPNLMLSTRESHNHTLTVVKGDLLFFRAHTNQTPFEELGVTWNPRVDYIGENPDPIQSASRHESSYQEGVLVGTNLEHTFKKKGKFRLEWPNFNNYDEDRVTIRVSFFKKGTDGGGNLPVVGNNVVIYEKTSGIREYSSFNSPNLDLDMSSITTVPSSFLYVKVEVLSDSEIDWGQLDRKFKPKLVSLNRDNTDVYLTPYYGNYSKVHTSYTPLQFIASGPNVRVTINNNFSLPACTEAVCRDRYVYLVARYSNGQIVPLVNSSSGAPSGYTKFRYKFDAAGNIVQKQRLNQNYVYQNLDNSNNINLTTSIGERFFFEYYTTEHKIGELLDAYQNSTATPLIKVTGGSPAPYTYMVGVDNTGKVKANVYTSEQTTAWGPMFRNWGQFGYKGADVGTTYKPIVGKNIHLFNTTANVTSSGTTAEDILEDRNLTLDQIDMDEVQGLAGNMTEYFGMLLPNKQKDRWESHEHLYISRTGVSPYTRFLTDEIPDLRPPTVPVGNYGAAGINKYSYFKNNTTNKSLGFLGFTVGRADSDGSSQLLNEFLDINGDGFPDIIGEQIQVTAKRGGLSSRIVQTNFNITTSINGSGSMAGGGSAGMSGSPKLGDQSNKSANLNMKFGNQASGSLGGNIFTTNNTTTRFYVDINGDGLIDIVQADGSVLLNYGGIFRQSSIWRNLPLQQGKTETKGGSAAGSLGGNFTSQSNLDISAGLSISQSLSNDQVSYMDLNGDGLPEKIVNGKYYINTGMGFESSGRNAPGSQAQKSIEAGINGNVTVCVYFPIPIIFTGPKFCISVGAAGGRSFSSEEGRYMDFDGDGNIDYVTSTKNESVTVYKSRIKRTNLLKKVIQSTGATISLDYDTKNPIDGSTIGTTYKMPYKKWALTKVSVYDGFEGDGKNTTHYAYEYFNGYKDRKERSFLGFGKTKAHLLHSNGAPFRTNVTEYVLDGMKESELYMPGTSSDLKQYIYKKGLPKKTYTLDKRQRLLSETTYDYKYYDSRLLTGDVNTASTSNAEVRVFTEKLSVLPLVTAIQTKNWTYQSETGTTALINETQQKFQVYDKMGNVKKYLDVDRGLTVEMTYSLGLKTLPISHRVAITAGNQQIRLTQATVTSDATRYETVTKFITNGQSVSTKFNYDRLGNIIAKTLPGGYVYKYEYGNDDYSSMHGDYFKILPGTIIDPFGSKTRIYYNAFGLPVVSIDVYNENIRYKYDAFNRLLEVKGPYETDWTIRNEYLNNRKAITQHNLGNGNILHTSMLTDGLGRVIQVKKQLENDSAYEGCETGNAAMRFAVSGKTIYDEFGRVVENYLAEEEVYCDEVPVDDLGLQNLTPEEVFKVMLTRYYETTDLEDRKIMTTYDDQDRILKQKVFGSNALTENTYGYTGNLMTQKIVLPEGNTTISYFDKLGQMTKKDQLGNGLTLSTNFAYDQLGQVKKVTNAANHATQYEYDLLGRVTKKTASSSGLTTFDYDNLGQIIGKKDANGTTIVYKYDFNRLIGIVGDKINADFGYEDGGRLKYMKDETGMHEFKYGKLGEVVEEKKLVYDRSGYSHYFVTRFKYDSWGRILEMVYPDKEKVFYHYNSVGQLLSIVNDSGFEYLSKVKYNYFDQPYYIQYGNKVEMKQEFDLMERLRAAQLSAPQPDNADIQSIFSRNVYGYDKNNNVKNMYNDFSQHATLNIGGTYAKTYSYDAFNRLASSTGHWEGLLEKRDYTLAMQYNKDHGIALKDQVHKVYDRNTQQTTYTENALYKEYKYEDSSKSQLSKIEGKDAYGTPFTQDFKYANNGNILTILSSANIKNALEYKIRNFKWDANNNIISIDENYGAMISTYLYDGKGERVGKRIDGSGNVNINGGDPLFGSYGSSETIYPNGYLVFGKGNYTKHYYANSKRIASRIGQSDDVKAFEKENYNDVQVSPHGSATSRIAAASRYSSRGIGEIADGVIPFPGGVLRPSQVSTTICKNQVDFLLNSLYNTPEKAYCKQQILEIIEQNKLSLKVCKHPVVNIWDVCREYETVVSIDYCRVLEQINAKGCVKLTDDGLVIDPDTGYIYDPLTGIPYDPITKKPIDLGLVKDQNRSELDCYNRFLNFIEYYKDKEKKPGIYFELIKYYNCLTCLTCKECYNLPGIIQVEDTVGHEGGWIKADAGYYIRFCDLIIPPIEEEEVETVEPDFPPVVIPPGGGDTWTDTPPVTVPIEANPLEQHGPVWWYHGDHLGSTSYITDVFGKPVQYIEYLPFGEVMVEQSTNNILENVYKFNAKELDTQTGYYYYGARYYDPGASIFLSVDPLYEQFPAWNPYHYVHNNPINLVDPTGMSAESHDQDPPKINTSNDDIARIPSSPPQQGYPGQGLDDLITSGIQWIGSLITGSDVSEETSGNIQLATTLAIVIVSKGKNVKAASEAAESVVKAESKAVSSRAARREVMRQEGIPTSQQAKTQSKNSSGREYTYEVPKSGGGTQTKSVQQQTLDSSHQGQPHWEAGTVKTDNGATRMNNYGRAKLNNNKSKVNY
ncbi:RHS repeat-associated core domain-containing protein [Myroides odoratus]|uniref:RHS repeat-associated core domain-containing protein n=1 Tax=Myroides odoratus TaxID=256 RepID=UPI00333E763B